MSSHYKLKATVDGSDVVAESLTLKGNIRSFKVFPTDKNETNFPIRGNVTVNIAGKNHTIQLTHKVQDYVDPEKSSMKWSYIESLYTTGSDMVPDSDTKSQDTAYIRASRGKTTYSNQHPQSPTREIMISKPYNSLQGVLESVGDFSNVGSNVGTYSKYQVVDLFKFTMYYKYYTESGDQIIPPTDTNDPSSHKSRIPCRPTASTAPSWVVNTGIKYRIEYTTTQQSSIPYSEYVEFDSWDQFISSWESISGNSDYLDATFHYIYYGSIEFNESNLQRPISGNGGITISEIDGGTGIHGAKPLYFMISQQEGKTVYSASCIPSTSSMQDSDGSWNFSSSMLELSNTRLSSFQGLKDGYKLRLKFNLDSSNKAKSIASITDTIITGDDGTVDYQYIGQPFILKLFKETANGIVSVSFRPYYKISPNGTTTEFWLGPSNLLGSQNFNPLRYDVHDGVNAKVILRSDVGCRGFLSGPMNGDHGLCILQLIPLCLYTADGTKYSPVPDQDNIINYSTRYDNYRSAITEYDRKIAAFLKWPNFDGNNSPDHIEFDGRFLESPLSYFGKIWESSIISDSRFKYIDRVMLVPVLWCNKRLEDDADFRTFLGEPRFGPYYLSPNIPDSEINSNENTIGRIYIEGLDIQMV